MEEEFSFKMLINNIFLNFPLSFSIAFFTHALHFNRKTFKRRCVMKEKYTHIDPSSRRSINTLRLNGKLPFDETKTNIHENRTHFFFHAYLRCLTNCGNINLGCNVNHSASMHFSFTVKIKLNILF